MLDAGDDLVHRDARLLDHLAALVDLVHRGVDQRLDLLGGDRAALRQAANLAGDDGEAAALFPRASGLDGRIERQDVGLEGDAVDDADDLDDSSRRGGDRVHRV
jgi:hypothetical protein